MAGKDNLKPFAKGHDPRRGNGRKSTKKITAYIQNALAQPNAEGADRTHLDEMVDKLITMAKGGNLKAMELCMAYAYGKPTQGIELSGDPDGAPIQLMQHDFTNLSNDELRDRINQLRAIHQQYVDQKDEEDDQDEDNTTAE